MSYTIHKKSKPFSGPMMKIFLAAKEKAYTQDTNKSKDILHK